MLYFQDVGHREETDGCNDLSRSVNGIDVKTVHIKIKTLKT